MQEFGLQEIEVVRDSAGKILQASGTLPDGTLEMVFQGSPSSSRPEQVQRSTSKRSDESSLPDVAGP
jgi:hypothetical protein